MDHIEIPLDGGVIIKIPNVKPLRAALIAGKLAKVLHRFERRARKLELQARKLETQKETAQS